MFNQNLKPAFNICRFPVAISFSLLLVACGQSDSPLVDLSEFLPDDVITQTLPEDTTVQDSFTADLDSESDTNINEVSAPIELSENQISIELALLTEGEIVTESRFDGSGEPIQDRFSLSISDYQLSDEGDFAALRAEDETTITVCTYIFVTAQYMCLRAFDLDINDRVWHLFTMQSATNGSGVFEFCTIDFDLDQCLDKLIANPDGTATVTIGVPSAFASEIIPEASPYFAYEDQGTLAHRSTGDVVGAHYSNAMNYLVAIAE